MCPILHTEPLALERLGRTWWEIFSRSKVQAVATGQSADKEQRQLITLCTTVKWHLQPSLQILSLHLSSEMCRHNINSQLLPLRHGAVLELPQGTCQVSLLYGGNLDGRSSSSAVSWSGLWGELKSLPSPPAAGTRELRHQAASWSCRRKLRPAKSTSAADNNWEELLPCQVQTISVSPGSHWGTSVSCNTHKKDVTPIY